MALPSAMTSFLCSPSLQFLSPASSLNQQAQVGHSQQTSRTWTSTGIFHGMVHTRAEQQAEQQQAARPKKQQQGWFYKNFVAEHTMEAKLEKFKKDVAARKGFVGSWFEDSFKYTAWVEVHRILTERNVQSLPCAEVAALAAAGEAVLLDVREPESFTKVRAAGGHSAPLFRLIQGDDLKANLRRLGYALLTNFAGTERNPDFIDQALKAVGGDKQKRVVVMCNIGGTLLTYVERKGPKAKKFNDPERLFGRQSRSLKAIFELQQAGFTDVIHLEGGFNQWCHQNLPIAGEGVDEEAW